jgi:hypothetical protein
MFPYLIQSTLFFHFNYLGVIPPKHGVIFPPVRSLLFMQKTIYMAYI